MFEGTVNRVFFTGKFDTGNLHEVSEGKISYYQPQKKSEADPVTAKPKYDSLEYDFLKKADRHFTLKTRPDAFGQPKQSGNRSWYHFAIKNESSNDLKVTLNIVDLNKHSKLYQQGLRPVVRCSGDDYKPVSDLHKDNFIEKNWRRLRWSAIAFGNVEEYGFCISFPVILPPGQYFYLAFCYPFSYTSSLRLLDLISQKVQVYNSHNGTDKIQYESRLLCKSYENRDVNLITITEKDKKRETAQHLNTTESSNFDNTLDSEDPEFTELDSSILNSSTLNSSKLSSKQNGDWMVYSDSESVIKTPFHEKHSHKKCIIVTARVHPGETPGQLNFSGFLRFVLSNDPRAIILRKHFVIRLVPILNPDGVYRGHFRMDYFGNNLNRFYIDHDPKYQPQCYALKTLIGWMVDARNSKTGQLQTDHLPTNNHSNFVDNVFFIDMHAHATKRGCFLFGNYLQDHAQQIENVLYAKLAEQNSVYFDFDNSNFSEKNMHVVDKRDGMARDGCTRVAFYKLFNLRHCYTLESNYNSGRWPARKLLPHSGKFLRELDNAEESSKLNWLMNLQDFKSGSGSPSGVYTDESCWLEVGAGLAVSILDVYQLMPKYLSRIPIFERIHEAAEKTLPSYVRGMKLTKAKSNASLKKEKSEIKKNSRNTNSGKKGSRLKPIQKYSENNHSDSGLNKTPEVHNSIKTLVNLSEPNLRKLQIKSPESRDTNLRKINTGSVSASSKSSTESRTNSTQPSSSVKKNSKISVKNTTSSYKASKYTTSKSSMENGKTPMKVVSSDVGDARALASIVQGYFDPRSQLHNNTVSSSSSSIFPNREKKKVMRDSKKYIGDLRSLPRKFDQRSVSGEMSISTAKLRFKRVPEIAKNSNSLKLE